MKNLQATSKILISDKEPPMETFMEISAIPNNVVSANEIVLWKGTPLEALGDYLWGTTASICEAGYEITKEAFLIILDYFIFADAEVVTEGR